MSAGGDPPRHSVALCCDFFYPRLGGVEMHIFSLAQALLAAGLRVCVVTNAYSAEGSSSTHASTGAAGAGARARRQRVGVRIMARGLRVYHLPLPPMAEQTVLPTFTAGFPLLRKVLLRERVTVVHGHAATSVLMHECLLQARTMGVRCVFTDHSLFSFHDFVGININKYLKLALSDVEHAICVSHTCRENLVLRAAVDPHRVSTIPNAVDADKFRPPPEQHTAASGGTGTDSGGGGGGGGGAASASPAAGDSLLRALLPHSPPRAGGASAAAPASGLAPVLSPPARIVTVVVVSRLVFRKGIDLLVGVIPLVCARLPHVRFVIGGDGPKRLLLEEMRERHRLQSRVELLGAVPHARVRDVLCRGDLFLNCSLTESFCIAVLEAACTGLHVVSTGVGGLPEVLPARMVTFAEPTAASLAEALCAAVPRAARGEFDKWSFHRELRDESVYNWASVASRTILVYDRVAAAPRASLAERFRRLYSAGRVLGPVAVALAALVHLYWVVLELCAPACDVDVVPFAGPEAWDALAATTTDAEVDAAHAAVDPWAQEGSGHSAAALATAPAAAEASAATALAAAAAQAAGSVAGFAVDGVAAHAPASSAVPLPANSSEELEEGLASLSSSSGAAGLAPALAAFRAAATAADGTIEATPRRTAHRPSDESDDGSGSGSEDGGHE